MIARTPTPEAIRTAATDAGSDCVWSLTGAPSHRAESTPERLAKLLRIQSYADDAMRDPAAFVRAYFDAIDNAVSDAAAEAREDEAFRCSPDACMGVAGQFSPR